MKQSGTASKQRRSDASPEPFGPYHIVGRLGRGSLTEVIEAKRAGVEGFEKRLVIKRFWPEYMKHQPLVRAWAERAKEAAQLSHANIAHVLDVGRVESNGGPALYVATEKVSGLSTFSLLDHARRTRQQLPIELCLHIAAETAKALDHAHRRRDADLQALRITHGDLTARNVLVSWEGEVKVTDFRLGRAWFDAYPNWQTEPVPFGRKLPYLSPELVRGGQPTEFSDQFSLGVLLFELLTGRGPFTAGTVAEILERIRETQRPGLRSQRGDVTEGVAALVARLLDSEPEGRYPSAAAVYEELVAQSYELGAHFGPGELSEWLNQLRDSDEGVAADAELSAEVEASFSHEPTPTAVRRRVINSDDPTASDESAPMSSRLRGTDTRLVGREKELRELGWALNRAVGGSVQVTGLIGDAGIGKTRLVREMVRRMRRGVIDVGYHVARCPSGGADLPNSALGAMLRALCGIDAPHKDLSADRAVQRLRELGLSSSERRAVLAELGADETPNRRARLRRALGAIADGLCRDRPTVLIWDNAHEMDSLSAELLETVVARGEVSRKLLIVFAGRREGAMPFEALPGYRKINIKTLGDDDQERLIREQLGAQVVSREVRDVVRHHTGGNPLFVEVFLREALESSAIRVDGGDALLLSRRALPEPRTLRDLLAKRVARLPALDAATLDAAAILGAPLDRGVLARVLDVTAAELEPSLARLIEDGLLRDRDELTFPTRLIAEVTVAKLAPKEHERLHHVAARAYLGGKAPSQADLRRVAIHLAEAGDYARASEFFASSGLAGLADGRLEQAVSDLSRALELGSEERTTVELSQWISALARVLRHVASATRLSSLLDDLVDRCLQDGALDGATRARALVDLGVCFGALHNYQRASELLDAASAVPGARPEVCSEAWLARAELANQQADYRAAIAALTAAKDASRSTRFLLAQAHALAGLCESQRAAHALARIGADEGPGVACEKARLQALANAARGDWTGVLDTASQAAQMARAAGLVGQWSLALQLVSDAYMRSGDLARAYGAAQRARFAADELGADKLLFGADHRLAYLDAAREGRPGSALDDLVQSAERAGWKSDAMLVRYSAAELDASTDPARAAEAFKAQREVARSCGNELLARACDSSLKSLDA